MDTFGPFYSSTGICTDTRKIESGSLFVCIQGDNFNGNTFSEKALELGASHVIVDDPEYFTKPEKMTLVQNSIVYLQDLALHHRRKFDIPVIGITGSNGKTTSKELINAVLSKKYNVLATQGNLNNHLGVPFTLLRMNDAHEIAIIEMGANRFRDIEELCAIAEPTHGIITNIGKAHLEGFGGFEGVLKTKRELYEAVSANKGLLVYNVDDPVLAEALPDDVKTLSYGTGEGDIRGELLGLRPFVEMKWHSGSYASPALSTQMIGKYNFYNFLAAAAFGHLFEVPNDTISEALTEYKPANNRSQVVTTTHNTLIMDCYNANPTSMKSALESFAMMDHPDKLVILGDMKELGEDTEKEHQNTIEQCTELGLKGFTVGTAFRAVESTNMQLQVETTTELLDQLESHPVQGKLILLKGSRGIGLEVLQSVL